MSYECVYAMGVVILVGVVMALKVIRPKPDQLERLLRPCIIATYYIELVSEIHDNPNIHEKAKLFDGVHYISHTLTQLL